MIRERLRNSETPDGRKTAVWRLDSGSVAYVLRLRCGDDPRPAYRWPDIACPEEEPGTVLFYESELPDLSKARELFPQHADLWDKIRSDRRAVVFDTCELPSLGSGGDL